MAVDVLKSLGVTDKPAGSTTAKPSEPLRTGAEAGLSDVVPSQVAADQKAPPEKAKPEGQGAGAASERDIRRVSVHLSPDQHRQLRILSITADTPIWKLCVEALVKAGMITQ